MCDLTFTFVDGVYLGLVVVCVLGMVLRTIFEETRD